MNWKMIRLELAPTADFPTGSVGRGFLIRAPLKPDGIIDESIVAQNPVRANVRRVWQNEPDQRGRLVRLDGHWAMQFPGKPDTLIDASAPFRPGEKVLVNMEGQQAPFTVRLFA